MREICSAWEILSQPTIGVFVAAALPRAAWIAEINLHVGANREALVVGHLLAAIPSQGATELRRQFAHLCSGRGDPVRRVTAGDLEKHHKAGMALDERCDVRVIRATEKVPFPMAGHSAVIDLGRPFADGNRIDDLSQPALCRATLGLAAAPRRATVCD